MQICRKIKFQYCYDLEFVARNYLYAILFTVSVFGMAGVILLKLLALFTIYFKCITNRFPFTQHFTQTYAMFILVVSWVVHFSGELLAVDSEMVCRSDN